MHPRRSLYLLAICTPLLASASGGGSNDISEDYPPIVFVHGNSANASRWQTTKWRFESNGWPADRLFSFDVPYPSSRALDDVPMAGRSSSQDFVNAISAAVDAALNATGAKKVVIVANSRGGLESRNYILNGGGADKVSAVVTGATMNHGLFNWPNTSLTSEFNGAGPILTKLNTQNGVGGDEVTHGMKWMTLRSDNNDKFAQPTGEWLRSPGVPTNVGYNGPALKGAENIVIPGADHGELSFGPEAFTYTYQFITSQKPRTTTILPVANPILNGKVFGLGLNNVDGDFATNLPLVNGKVEVYATDPETGMRRGPAVHTQLVGSDGYWGPFAADGKSSYEFVITMTGYATTHVYRSAFPRSTDVAHLQAQRLAPADLSSGSTVQLLRSRGFFGIPRNNIKLDGKSPPDGIQPGVAGVNVLQSTSKETANRTVVGEFDGERIVGRTWPASANDLTVLDLQN